MGEAKVKAANRALTADEVKEVSNIIAGLRSMLLNTEAYIVGAALCGLLAQVAIHFGENDREDTVNIIKAWTEAQVEIADRLLANMKATRQ